MLEQSSKLKCNLSICIVSFGYGFANPIIRFASLEDVENNLNKQPNACRIRTQYIFYHDLHHSENEAMKHE